jgi:hypothetical protein
VHMFFGRYSRYDLAFTRLSVRMGFLFACFLDTPLIGCGKSQRLVSTLDNVDASTEDPETTFIPVVSCPPGTYVGGLTPTASCFPCPTGSFSDAADAPRCTLWSDCLPGSHVHLAGTATRDRSCAPCSIGTESTSTNQAVCTPTGTCAAGTVLRPGGKPSDCDPCVAGEHCPGAGLPKEECAAGFWDHDNDPATPCVEARHCLSGERVVRAPTALADRACTACESGSFSTTIDAPSCTTWTTCLPGTFVSQQGSATGDRACASCAAGTLSTSPNQSACLPEGACLAGTRQIIPATPTTDAVCEPCLAGRYCAGGEAPELLCPEGSWDDDGNAATECVPWTDCVPGQSVFTAGSSLIDRTCVSCPSSAFSVTANARQCALWTACEAGSFVSFPGSSLSDRMCTACPPDTFTSARNQSECLPVGACAAGTLELVPATPRTPAVCVACEAGTYCAGGTASKVTCPAGTWDNDQSAATTCIPHTTCGAGLRVLVDGTATIDLSCVACTSGSFSTSINAGSCTPWQDCAAGTFVSTQGSATQDRACTACATGTYTSNSNQNTCIPQGSCSPGTEQTSAGTATFPPSARRVRRAFIAQARPRPSKPAPMAHGTTTEPRRHRVPPGHRVPRVNTSRRSARRRPIAFAQDAQAAHSARRRMRSLARHGRPARRDRT